jgi:PAS domain S-box-containing protein
VSSKSTLAFEEGFNLLPDAILIFTTSGRILNCNQSTLRQFGVKSKWEIIGTNLFERISEADRTKAMDSPSFGIEQGFKKSVVFLFLRVDGTEYSAEFTVVPMVDASGKTTAQVGIIRDITERRNIEEELEESKETVKALLNAPQDAAYLVDRYGKVYAANDFGSGSWGRGATR